MLSATLLGVFLVPLFFVLVPRPWCSRKGKCRARVLQAGVTLTLTAPSVSPMPDAGEWGPLVDCQGLAALSRASS